MSNFIVNITREIPAKEIADQFIAAIEEGGSQYWCSQILPKKLPKVVSETPWYASPELWADPEFVILVTEIDSEDDESKDTVHEITHEAIGKGLQVMAEKYAHVFQEIIDDNADAGTADIFLQCVVFGEEKYA